MTSRFLSAFAAAAFLFTGAAWADDLAGTYLCKGVDTTGAAYSGTAIIEKRGDTYQVAWTLGKAKYLGIGIRAGDVLSVAYYGKINGVIAYQISADKLSGTWAIANNTGRVGVETLSR